jgi:hypothetical protein
MPAGATTVIDTLPTNPLSGVMAILVVPEVTVSMLMELELAEILKSGMLIGVTATVTVIVCETELLVPIICTV